MDLSTWLCPNITPHIPILPDSQKIGPNEPKWMPLSIPITPSLSASIPSRRSYASIRLWSLTLMYASLDEPEWSFRTSYPSTLFPFRHMISQMSWIHYPQHDPHSFFLPLTTIFVPEVGSAREDSSAVLPPIHPRSEHALLEAIQIIPPQWSIWNDDCPVFSPTPLPDPSSPILTTPHIPCSVPVTWACESNHALHGPITSIFHHPNWFYHLSVSYLDNTNLTITIRSSELSRHLTIPMPLSPSIPISLPFSTSTQWIWYLHSRWAFPLSYTFSPHLYHRLL